MEVNKQAEGLQDVWDANQVLRDVAVKAVELIKRSTSMSVREKHEFLAWANERLERV